MLKTLHWILSKLKAILLVLGIIFLVMLILAFTKVPYMAYYKLGSTKTKLSHTPNYIVLFGGSGMPSPDGLIRAYYTASIANKYKHAKIIIANPNELNAIADSSASYTYELALRNIDVNRIQYDTCGYNTYTQAKHIAQIILNDTLKLKNTLVVTSPEHMFRSIRCLKKAGIDSIGGFAAFEIPLSENDLVKEKLNHLEKEKLNLRYNVWSYLNYEFVVLREYCAISYYKVRGYL